MNVSMMHVYMIHACGYDVNGCRYDACICDACPPAAAAAAPPIENMVKFRYEPTNGGTNKAILGVGCTTENSAADFCVKSAQFLKHNFWKHFTKGLNNTSEKSSQRN